MMMFSTETLLSKTSSSCLGPPSVVPCAVLLLETPSDLAKAVWFGLRQYSLCELAVCLGSNALVAIRLSLA